MKRVYLDTSHVLEGLDALLPERSEMSHETLTDTIDLMSHLICREKVYYDGEVFGKQRERLVTLLDKAQQHLGPSEAGVALETKLIGIVFPSSEDSRMAQRALKRTAGNAARLRTEVKDLSHVLEKCSSLPSADDFEDAVKKVLIPNLRSAKAIREVDAIWTDKKIAGRRFIWAALKDESSRNLLRGAMANLRNPARLFQLLFSHFRAEFAVERNDAIAARDQVDSGDIFYASSVKRSSILATAFRSPRAAHLTAEEAMHEQIVSGWFRVDRDSSIGHLHLPMQIRLVLAKIGDGSPKRIDFLKAALEISGTHEAAKLSNALESLAHAYIGTKNPNVFIKDLCDDVSLVKRTSTRWVTYGSLSEVLLEVALVSAATLTDPAAIALGLIAGGLPYMEWRFRKTRVIAQRIAGLLSSVPTEEACAARFRSIFGVDPPFGRATTMASK